MTNSNFSNVLKMPHIQLARYDDLLLIDLFNYASGPTSGNPICLSIRVDLHLSASWFSFVTVLKDAISVTDSSTSQWHKGDSVFT